MASCNVQATPSDVGLEVDATKAKFETDKGADVEVCAKNEAGEKAANAGANNIDGPQTETEAKPITGIKGDACNINVNRMKKIGTVLPPTKIPGPVRLNKSGSYIIPSTRKYTSVMKSQRTKDHDNSFSSTSTLVNVTEDSGVLEDCSVVEDNDSCSEEQLIRPACSTPVLRHSNETIATTASLQELAEDERQTLKVLQRAVAEMEADVIYHEEMLEDLITFELDKKLEQQVEQELKQNILQAAMEQLQQLNLDQLQLTEQANQSDLQQKQPDQPENITSDEKSNSHQVHVQQRDRNHAGVEQVFKADHAVGVLHQLLHMNTVASKCEAEGAGNSILECELEEESIPTPSEESTPINDKNTDRPKNRIGQFHSLLSFLCGKGIRKFGYPILICGMAVGLIFYFRKD